MAGTHSAAPETARQAPIDASTGHPHHPAPAASRTRLVHGGWAFGPVVAAVYSSRREADCRGVTLTLSDGALQLSAHMLPAQAREVAAALTAAAVAVEQRGAR